jgi:phosphoribosyl-ATP pyrophosphohydrolase/phosphoribosyl-AMP cyclohydrolase
VTSSFDIKTIDWAKGDGLVPVVVQDVRSLRVLMLGYVNAEALQLTQASGLMAFYSRTKQRLWQKGETSGHVLRVRDIKLDCDNDTLLVMAEPEGATCHNGTTTCFGDDETPSLAILADLAEVIHQRRLNPETGSYTAKLFAEGLTRIAQKVGEEGVETALAGATRADNLASEASDLLYHLIVLLEASEVSLQDVLKILHTRSRAKKSS